MKVITEIESVNLSNGDRTRRVVGDGESRIERSRGFVDEVSNICLPQGVTSLFPPRA